MKTKDKTPDGTVLSGKWRVDIDGPRHDYRVGGIKLTRTGNGRKGPAVVVEIFGPVHCGSDLTKIFEAATPCNITLIGDTVDPEASSPVIEVYQAEPVSYHLGTFDADKMGKAPSCEVVTFEAETWAFKARGGS